MGMDGSLALPYCLYEPMRAAVIDFADELGNDATPVCQRIDALRRVWCLRR